MATVSQMKEAAAPLLPPGIKIQRAFVCQTATNFVIFVINWLTGLTLGLITYRCIAVTSDAINVLDAHRLSGGATPRSVVATLPRPTQLGPVHGRWSEFALLGQRYWVKQRFQDQITAADTAAGFRYSATWLATVPPYGSGCATAYWVASPPSSAQR